jgi:hypothetical protein
LDRLFDWLNRQAMTSISGLNASRPLTLRRLNGQRRFNSASQIRAASDPSPIRPHSRPFYSLRSR